MTIYSIKRCKPFALILALFCVSPAIAQFPPATPMMPPQMNPQAYMMMQQQMFAPGTSAQASNPMAMLNLSKEQQDQLAEIGNEARAQSVEFMNQIGNIYNAMRELFTAEQPDSAAIGEAYGTIFDLQRKTIELAIESYNKQVQVLNEQQLNMWNTMRQSFLQRFMPAAPAPKQTSNPPSN